MTKSLLLAAALLVITFSSAAFAQDTSKKEIKPALSPSQEVLARWNEIGAKLSAMAEDFPEDKYDFKPNPAERSFAEQLLHAAAAAQYFTNAATGQKPPQGDNPRREDYKTKADVVALVKKTFADGGAAIQSKGDKGMSDVVVGWGHRQTRVSDFAYRPSNIPASTMDSWSFTTASPASSLPNRETATRGLFPKDGAGGLVGASCRTVLEFVIPSSPRELLVRAAFPNPGRCSLREVAPRRDSD
jgi:hypothetical protein